jgi:hypothetical protein
LTSRFGQGDEVFPSRFGTLDAQRAFPPVDIVEPDLHDFGCP